jgi:hypothetical protein
VAGRSQAFRKVITADRANTQLQDNVADAISEVIKNPLLNGRLIENVGLGTTVNNVEHKLNRKLTGYLIVSVSAPVTIHDDLTTVAKPELYLPLTASAPCVVKLWVF